MAEPSTREPRWLPALAVVAIAAAVVAPVMDLLSGAAVLVDRDIHKLFRPMAYVLQRALEAHRLPEWDPGVASGQPFLGLGQTQVLYPPKWLQLVSGPDLGLSLLAVLHPIVGALLLFGLARRRGSSIVAAALAGVLMGASPLMFATYRVPNLEYAACLFPGVLWLGFACAARPSLRHGALAGLLIGLCGLAGAFELALGEGLGFALVAALYATERRQVLPAIGVAASIAVLLALPEALPVLNQAAETARAKGFSLEEASRWSLRFTDLVDLFVPRSPEAHANVVEYRREHQALLGALYVGAAALTLAAAGFQKQRRLLIPALVMVLLALGAKGGLFAGLHLLPGADKLRYPVKFLLLALPFLGLAVAEGVDALRAPPRWLGAIALPSMLLVLLWGAGTERFVGAACVAAVGALAAMRANGNGRLALLLALVVADLTTFTMRRNVVMQMDREDFETLRAAAPPADLRYRVADGLTEREWFDLAVHEDQPLEQYAYSLNFPEVSGARIAGGYGPNVNAKIAALASAGEGALDLLGARWVHTLPGTHPGKVERSMRYTDVLRRDTALPRGVFMTRYEVLAPAEIEKRVLAKEFDPRAALLLEWAPSVPSAEGGQAAVLLEEPSPEEIHMRVDAASPGLVLLQDTFDVGWSAMRDGRPAEVLRAYGALMAVETPAGTHEIVLRFRSRPMRNGLWGALAGLVIALGCVSSGRRRLPLTGLAAPAERR